MLQKRTTPVTDQAQIKKGGSTGNKEEGLKQVKKILIGESHAKNKRTSVSRRRLPRELLSVCGGGRGKRQEKKRREGSIVSE